MSSGKSSGVTVLAVDDDEDALFTLEALLDREGYSVVTARNGSEALEKARASLPDLILSDVVMPSLDGLELTKRLKADSILRFIPIILLTSKDSLEDVTSGLEIGADDYIKKPYQQEELIARLQAARRTRSLYLELEQIHSANRALRQEIGQRHSFDRLIGKSEAMQDVYSLVEKVAGSDVPVMISGESGTGKELVARAIHHHSIRKDQPFVVQNCSAFSENLLESELFGHVRGAFTGALRDKQGLFEAADKGTFFLDELGEMSLALQAKLLRVLQDGTFTPVGSTAQRTVDVRIVTATNRNLEEMIEAGSFREDLYYRLNVVSISLPPLRERRADIPLLVDHLMQECSDSAESLKSITKEALLLLSAYGWPGNVRELRNEVERMLLMSGTDEVVSKEHLSPKITAKSSDPSASHNGARTERSLKSALSELEREMIAEALTRTGGNKSEAARQLGISRSSLITKVKDYHLEPGS